MSSTLYTIGTALRRAHAHHDEHSVVRLESVSAVRVHGRLPATPERDAHESADHESEHVSLQPA
jgi:hypothetical protein